jgi:septal ring factor EnvC (AmiA/AmiB activator)
MLFWCEATLFKIQILDMNKRFVAKSFIVKPFVAKVFLLLMACSSWLLINSASAAPAATTLTATATVAAASSTGSAFSTVLTFLATYKGMSAKTSEDRSLRRKRKGLRMRTVVSRRKTRRLSGKMEVAMRRTHATEERKTEGILYRMTGSRPPAGLGADALLAETGSMKEGLVSFGRMRGHLRWPVESRTILIPFGRYEYMRNVIGNNNGITIAAEEGMDVRAVADGRVQEVFPDLDAVMISHGVFFTTYINLSAITVCKGDEIKSGQVLGSVGPDGQVDFWLSDDKVRMLDPEKWLRK